MRTKKIFSLLLICLSINITAFADDWVNYNKTKNSILVNNIVSTVMQDSSSNLWFGPLGGGAVKFDDDTTWTNYSTSNSIVDDWVYCMMLDKDNDIWGGSFGAGVFKFVGDTVWKNYTSTDGLANDAVYAMAQDNNGNMWFGTYGGLSKFGTDSTWTTYTSSTGGLAKDEIYSLITDKQGNLWIGYGNAAGGVSKFDGSSWTTYTKSNSSLLNDSVYSILQDNEGNMWFGTLKGVSKLDGNNTWTSYTTADGLVSSFISSILQDTNDNMWFGSFGSGISKFNGTDFTSYTTTNSGLSHNTIYKIIQDRDNGDLWIATRGGGIDKLTLFSVTPNTISFKASPDTTTLSINTYKDWTIVSTDSWLTLSAESGSGDSTIMATAEKNTTTSARTSTLYLLTSGLVPQTITVTQAAAISEAVNLNMKQAVTITPNPVKDAFQVSGLEGAALLSLTDTNGKVVFSKEITGNESISVSSLPQGLYIVKLTTANGVVQQKLIKQ